MKPSERLVLFAIILGLMIGGGIAYLGAPWYVAAPIGFIAATITYDKWIKMAAAQNLVDRW